MKKFLKIGTLAISSAILLGCVACGGDPSDKPDKPDPDRPGAVVDPVDPITPSYFGEVEGTVHEWNTETTGGFLLKDGKTDYKILVGEQNRTDEFISFAVSDFRSLFEEATGAGLEVVYDGAMVSGDKYFAIGETKLVQNASIGATEEELGIGGFVIRTVNDSVVMTGATNEASMNAVYGWLEYELGFDLYYTDFYALDTGVTEIPLRNYRVKDVPDFDYRIQSTGWIRYDSSNVKRMRWTKETNLFIPADRNTATWHNTFVYLPKTAYQKAHPEWYSEGAANQLCYTAHGNAESRKEMLKIVSDQMIDLFSDEAYQDYKWITFSIEDNQNCCSCETCAAEKAKYGADSAVIVKFCNELAEIVNDWMNTEEGLPHKRSDFKIFFFAYHATNAAPAAYDEATDSYSPIDDSVICNEHVAVYFAETNGDYVYNLSDKGTANTVVGDNMRAWRALTDEIYFWSYSTNFNYFLTPYNSFDAVQDIYKFAKQNNTVYMMTQDQWVQPNAQTGWGIYKNWLHAKLGWNVNADVDALTVKFFRGYFGEAADVMLKLFYEYRVWAQYQTEELGYKGSRSVYINAVQEKFWPQRMLEGWLREIDAAYEAIEPLKNGNPARYAELREHICIESVAYRYLQLALYNARYDAETVSQLKKELVGDVQRIGMTRMSNNKTLESIFNGWNF